MLSESQKNALIALRDCGGILDRWNRIVASGEVFNSATTLSLFARGYMHTDRSAPAFTNLGRVYLTPAGRKALEAD